MSFDPSAAGWFALAVCVRAVLAAAGVALVLRLLRIRSAAVRHAAWTLLLIAMFLMPLLPSVVPALPLPISTPVALMSEELTPGGISHTMPSATTVGTVTATASGETIQSGEPGPRPAPMRNLPSRWLPSGLMAIYGAGVLLILARTAYGWYVASRMVRRAQRRGPVRVDISSSRLRVSRSGGPDDRRRDPSRHPPAACVARMGRRDSRRGDRP